MFSKTVGHRTHIHHASDLIERNDLIPLARIFLKFVILRRAAIPGYATRGDGALHRAQNSPCLCVSVVNSL